MTATEPTVVRREIVVEATTADAFATFTERFGDFKPPEHNLMAVPIVETVFEPRVGGHIIDRAQDGTECRVGARFGLRSASAGGLQLGHQPRLAARDRT